MCLTLHFTSIWECNRLTQLTVGTLDWRGASVTLNLKQNMMGSPTQVDWRGFNRYVIASLPTLEFLDGKETMRTERILLFIQQSLYNDIIRDI